MIETEPYKKSVDEGTQQSLKDFKDKGFKFLEEVENKFSCGGFCSEPLFYTTQDINKGRPTKDCLKELVGKLIDSAVSFTAVGGVILLITFILSLPILCGIPADAGNDVFDDEVE